MTKSLTETQSLFKDGGISVTKSLTETQSLQRDTTLNKIVQIFKFLNTDFAAREADPSFTLELLEQAADHLARGTQLLGKVGVRDADTTLRIARLREQ